MRARIDLTGKTFSKLTVTGWHSYSESSHQTKWLCACNCGNTTVASTGNLKNLHTTSCGCNRKEISAKVRITHGLLKIGKSIYGVWSKAKSRCFNENNPKYKEYGGRGILMSDEWKSDFNKFYEWCIQNGYKKGLTIDRINNNKGYCAENCRFTSMLVQNRNKRNNIIIDFNGEKGVLSEFAEKYNIPYKTLHKRISNGWSVEKAICTKPRVMNKKKVKDALI